MNLTGSAAKAPSAVERIQFRLSDAKTAFKALYGADVENCTLCGPAAALWRSLVQAEAECQKATEEAR